VPQGGPFEGGFGIHDSWQPNAAWDIRDLSGKIIRTFKTDTDFKRWAAQNPYAPDPARMGVFVPKGGRVEGGEIFRSPSRSVDLVGHKYPGSPPQIEVFYYRVPGSEDVANVPNALRGQAGKAFHETLAALRRQGEKQVAIVDPSRDMKVFLAKAEARGWIRSAGTRPPRGRGDVSQPVYDILVNP
jgi:hypothetical protein